MAATLSLPNFFIIGASKSGTSSLYSYAKQHCDVYMPAVKEPGFFAVDALYAKGLKYYSRSFFSGAARHAARGEATPSYLYSDRAAERIQRDLPPESHRFIAILRDPVERAYSMYWHLVRTGVETGTFEEGLAAESDRLRDPAVAAGGSFAVGYVLCGRYAAHLSRWRDRFGGDKVLVLFHEDLRANPLATVRQAFAFLGVDADVSVDVRSLENVASATRVPLVRSLTRAMPRATAAARHLVPDRWWLQLDQFIDAKNRRPASYPSMQDATRQHLRTVFEEDVRGLEAMTGRNLAHWRA